ncbi:MAG: ethanolamine permease [Acidobacteria bacterium]|nr:ethanolamine permease [Acidobacteriota bacterium]
MDRPSPAAETPRLAPVAGPFLLWGLGVGYVISGDFYGWNAGLGATGYLGYLVALGFAAVLYAALVLAIAELSAALPHAGGPYAFCRLAMGRLCGYLCGVAVLLEYVVAPAAIATAIGAYVNVLVPSVPVLVSAAAVYVVCIAVHLMGAELSLSLELGLTTLALLMLTAFVVVAFPSITTERLLQVGSGEVFPKGAGGLWAALPSAAWFFLAIEGLPMAAEEARNARRDLPVALMASFATLAVAAICVLTVSAGLGGAAAVGSADAPLPTAVRIGLGQNHWLLGPLSLVGLAGLLASFQGIILSYSRLTFALSRAGYIPGFLSKLNGRKAPVWAIVVPGIASFSLASLCAALPGQAIPTLVSLSVFGAAVSYILTMAAAILLRRRRDLHRPFRAPGGSAAAWIALALSVVLLPAGLREHPVALVLGALVFGLFLLLYFTYGRARTAGVFAEEELGSAGRNEA